MTQLFAASVLFALTLTPLHAMQAPSVPLGAGRPATPGISRVALRDDARTGVVRVTFEPGAKEPPHSHPYDVLLIPLADGDVDFSIGERRVTSFAAGTVHFIPRMETHWLTNTSAVTLRFITVALK